MCRLSVIVFCIAVFRSALSLDCHSASKVLGFDPNEGAIALRRLNTSDPVNLTCLESLNYIELSAVNISAISIIYNDQKDKIMQMMVRYKEDIHEGDFFTNTFLLRRRLKILSLDINSIESFDNISLPIRTLSLLKLRKNMVSSLERVNLSGMDRLRDLNLEYNEIKTLEKCKFIGSGASNLRFLSLQGNKISTLENAKFEGLVSLTELKLDNNVIDSLERVSLRGLVKLKYLSLKSNRIKSLDNVRFIGADHLTQFDISMTNIGFSTPIRFEGVPSLTDLFFSTFYADSLPLSLEIYGAHKLESINIESKMSNLTLRGDLDNFSRLTLAYNPTSSVKNFNIQGVNRLKELKLVAFNVGSLDDLATWAFPNLVSLDLNSNRINSLKSICLENLGNLRQLILANNKIGSISQVSFLGDSLKSLEYLFLNSNNIMSLEEASFFGLPKLRVLSFDYNKVENLTNVNFTGASNLKILSLNSNLIRTLVGTKFHGVEALEYLYLRQNYIDSLADVSFFGLSSLIQLDLSLNSIMSLDEASFRGLCSLKVLIFSGNIIESLENATFHGLQQLDELHLSVNFISSLGQVSIHPLKSLNLLDLSFNQIESLAATQFSTGLDSVTTLDLGFNRIPSIDDFDFLHHSTKFSFIYLEENPLQSIDLSAIFNTSDFLKNPIPKIFFSYKFNDDLYEYVKSDKQVEDFNHYYLKYFYLSQIRMDQNSSQLIKFFFRKRVNLLKKHFQIYQSIPVKLDPSVYLNCSVMLYIFRKCKIMRLLIGDRVDYELFIQNCYNEDIQIQLNFSNHAVVF